MKTASPGRTTPRLAVAWVTPERRPARTMGSMEKYSPPAATIACMAAAVIIVLRRAIAHASRAAARMPSPDIRAASRRHAISAGDFTARSRKHQVAGVGERRARQIRGGAALRHVGIESGPPPLETDARRRGAEGVQLGDKLRRLPHPFLPTSPAAAFAHTVFIAASS